MPRRPYEGVRLLVAEAGGLMRRTMQNGFPGGVWVIVFDERSGVLRNRTGMPMFSPATMPANACWQALSTETVPCPPTPNTDAEGAFTHAPKRTPAIWRPTICRATVTGLKASPFNMGVISLKDREHLIGYAFMEGWHDGNQDRTGRSEGGVRQGGGVNKQFAKREAEMPVEMVSTRDMGGAGEVRQGLLFAEDLIPTYDPPCRTGDGEATVPIL